MLLDEGDEKVCVCVCKVGRRRRVCVGSCLGHDQTLVFLLPPSPPPHPNSANLPGCTSARWSAAPFNDAVLMKNWGFAARGPGSPVEGAGCVRARLRAGLGVAGDRPEGAQGGTGGAAGSRPLNRNALKGSLLGFLSSIPAKGGCGMLTSGTSSSRNRALNRADCGEGLRRPGSSK